MSETERHEWVQIVKDAVAGEFANADFVTRSDVEQIVNEKLDETVARDRQRINRIEDRVSIVEAAIGSINKSLERIEERMEGGFNAQRDAMTGLIDTFAQRLDTEGELRRQQGELLRTVADNQRNMSAAIHSNATNIQANETNVQDLQLRLAGPLNAMYQELMGSAALPSLRQTIRDTRDEFGERVAGIQAQYDTWQDTWGAFLQRRKRFEQIVERGVQATLDFATLRWKALVVGATLTGAGAAALANDDITQTIVEIIEGVF